MAGTLKDYYNQEIAKLKAQYQPITNFSSDPEIAAVQRAGNETQAKSLQDRINQLYTGVAPGNQNSDANPYASIPTTYGMTPTEVMQKYGLTQEQAMQAMNSPHLSGGAPNGAGKVPNNANELTPEARSALAVQMGLSPDATAGEINSKLWTTNHDADVAAINAKGKGFWNPGTIMGLGGMAAILGAASFAPGGLGGFSAGGGASAGAGGGMTGVSAGSAAEGGLGSSAVDLAATPGPGTFSMFSGAGGGGGGGAGSLSGYAMGGGGMPGAYGGELAGFGTTAGADASAFGAAGGGVAAGSPSYFSSLFGGAGAAGGTGGAGGIMSTLGSAASLAGGVNSLLGASKSGVLGGGTVGSNSTGSGYNALPPAIQAGISKMADKSGALLLDNPNAANMFTPMGVNGPEQQAYGMVNPDPQKIASEYMNPFNDALMKQIGMQFAGGNSQYQKQLADSGQLGGNRDYLNSAYNDMLQSQAIGTTMAGEYNSALGTGLSQNQLNIQNLLGQGSQLRGLDLATKQAPVSALEAYGKSIGLIPQSSAGTESNKTTPNQLPNISSILSTLPGLFNGVSSGFNSFFG